MSEDAPRIPPAGEQPPEYPTETTEELGEAALNSATQIPVQDGETEPADTVNTRWDEDKARTVGMAAKESDKIPEGREGYSYHVLDERAFDNEKLNKERKRNESQANIDDLMDSNHRDLVDELKWAKDAIERLETDGKDVPEEFRKRLKEAQEAYDAAEPGMREFAGTFTEGWERGREEAIERITSPFEELYEMNPELFAKMPTAEFIEVRKGLTSIEEDLTDTAYGLELLAKETDKLNNAIEAKKSLKWEASYEEDSLETVIRAATNAGNILGGQGAYKEIQEKYAAEYSNDHFDKTPRQITEGYQRLTNEYIDQLRAKLAETEQAKQEFMAKYSKNSEPSVNSSETQAT